MPDILAILGTVGQLVGVLLILLYVVAYKLLQDKTMCTLKPELRHKVYVITGATRGLGKETARRLAQCEATVVMLNRDSEASERVIEEMRKETHNDRIYFLKCDLSDLDSVLSVSKKLLSLYPTIDGLVCNAGVMLNKLVPTKQGFEPHFGINFLSHFVLTHNLMPALKRSNMARVVMLSSCGQWFTRGMNYNRLTARQYFEHGWKYDWFSAYCRSKLAMVLFAKQFQRVYGDEYIVAVSAAPGVILTDLWRNVSPIIYYFLKFVAFGVLKTVEQGAQTEIRCCLDDLSSLVPGAYYDRLKPTMCHPLGYEESAGSKLWETACEYAKDYLIDDKDHTPEFLKKVRAVLNDLPSPNMPPVRGRY